MGRTSLDVRAFGPSRFAAERPKLRLKRAVLKEAAAGDSAMAEYRRELRLELARELHDGPVQTLTESVMRLEGYRAAAPSGDMQAAISDIEEGVRIALLSLRHLITELRDEPPDIDVAERIRSMAARYQSSTKVEVAVVTAPDWPDRLPLGMGINLIRIAQEAITNAIRHADAGHVLVELGADEKTLTLDVADDGCGLPDDVIPGSGLIGIRERTALLGGRLVMKPRHPGTEVRIEVPRP